MGILRANSRGSPALAWAFAAAALIVFALVLAGLSPRSAAAHAYHERSEPAPNEIVESALGEVRVWFTERLEPAYSVAEVFDQDGDPVAGVDSRVSDDDPYLLLVELPDTLPNGTYSVAWQNISADDGHPAQGYFPFTVGTEADVAVVGPVAVETGGPPEWVKVLARWTALLGLAAAVAIWPMWVLVLRPAIAVERRAGAWLARRARWLAVWALGLAIGGSVFALLVQGMAATGSIRPGDGLWTTLTGTRYGEVWLLRLALFLALAIVLTDCSWWRPWQRRGPTVVALALAVVLPIPFSLISHASAQQVGRATATAFDVLHLLGASVWAGGLFVLAGALIPAARRLSPEARQAVLARAIPRFSLLALIAWAVMGFTGFYSAWLQVGSLDGLRETAYGQSLLVKLLLLVPLLLLGAANLLVVSRGVQSGEGSERAGITWSRRFSWTVGAEVVLVVLVLLVVGRLIGQPPARESVAMETAETTVSQEFQLDPAGGTRPATLSLSPGAAGPNQYVVEIGGDTLPAETEALLRVNMPAADIGMREIDLERVAGNAFEARGSELSIAGEWDVQLIVRLLGEFNFSTSETVAMPATPPAPAVSPPEPAWAFDRAGLVGLGLLVVGITGVVVAWAVGRVPLRLQTAGLGTLALALGVVLLLQARIDPEQVRTAQPVHHEHGAGHGMEHPPR